uniref:ATP synthase F0 subunit 8 n=1 Tax=Eusyllis blomstrandi TaxID=199554 RepID=A0A1C9UZB5_EUSBL|nr:ATP synthase F0 subunit 8 [Eusyllis blomstrandi]AOR87115.1 ATP synthase F0 subunit 8 [Eusyllis blomstrandi]
MPHLSPMSWLIVPLMIWFIVFSLSSMMWYSKFPMFLNLTNSKEFSFNKWNWY